MGQYATKLSIVAFAAIGGLLLCSSSVNGSASDLRGLELRLILERPTVVVYEPVVLRFAVRNGTEHMFRSAVRTRGDTTDLYVKIQYEQETPIAYVTGPIGTYIKPQDTVHAAGQVMEDEKVLFFNDRTDKVAFPRAGKYRVAARMAVGGDRNEGEVLIGAPTVSLDVVDPSESDRSMIADVGSEDALVRLLRLGVKAFCKGGEAGEACLNRLGRIVYQRRESAYAPFLCLELARPMGEGALDVDGRRVSAIDLLQDFQRLWPGHPIRSKVAETLVFKMIRGGDLEGARGFLTGFEGDYPNRWEAIRAMRKEMEGTRSIGDGEAPEVP